MRWPWFPPEAHIHTGRLCSAGSGCHPVPRRPRSYAALRLPRLVGCGSGSPCLWPTSMRTLLFTALRGVRLRAGVGEGSPDSPSLRKLSRKARASQVPGPSSSCVPWSETPPGAVRSSPISHGATAVAFRQKNTLGTRNEIVFEATNPRPTRSRAYASPAASPRPSQGSLPARAGSPLARRVSHPLDDVRSSMESSQPPFPFDQPCLVAPFLPIRPGSHAPPRRHDSARGRRGAGTRPRAARALCRYAGRPPVATQLLSRRDDGRLVYPWGEGSTVIAGATGAEP